MIWKIIRNETWLESERRGCEVPANDRVVKENVCRVVLRIGQQLRDAIEAQLAHPVADVAQELRELQSCVATLG